MVKSSLIQCLFKLSKKEIERFLLFVKSPYYNSNSHVKMLIKYFLLHFDNYDSKNFDKEIIYKHVYSNNTFNYVQLRRLFSTTLSLLEEMLITEHRNENELSNHLDLLNVLIAKKMDKRIGKAIQKVENILSKPSNFIHSEDYYIKYKMIDLLDEWYISQSDFSKPHLIQQKVDALDIQYIIEKLYQSCEMLNREGKFAGRNEAMKYQYPFIEAIDQYVTKDAYFKNVISLNIYHKIYKSLVAANDEDNYFELCNLVEKHIELFDRADGADIYVNLMNFATRKINQGKTQFFSHIFKIQKEMLANGFLINNGIMPHLSYQNLVTTALGLKEYKWAKNFIQEYKTYLPESIKDNAYNYNLAVYCCETNDYEKAHDLLVNIEYNNLMYNLNARAMLLRVFFETDEIIALEAHTSAFKVYLMRNKMINKDKYRRYYNLFRFTESLFKIKQHIPYKNKRVLKLKFDKLLKKIDESGRLPFKRWLYKQTATINDAIS